MTTGSHYILELKGQEKVWEGSLRGDNPFQEERVPFCHQTPIRPAEPSQNQSTQGNRARIQGGASSGNEEPPARATPPQFRVSDLKGA